MEILIVLGVVGAAVGFRMLAGVLNKERIRTYVSDRGGRVSSIKWSPFGKGWFGEKDAVIYEVAYSEPDGTEHLATCKTAFFSGVYFTEDRVVGELHRVSRSAALEAENRRLREELQAIKKDRVD